MRPLGLAIVSLLLAAAPAAASSAPDAGRPFGPPPLTEARYGVADPVVRIVEAADGTDLYTETWRPAAKDGATPPTRVPVVVEYSPYSAKGAPENPDRMRLLVSRGYAFTQAHVRGSGGSGGCIEQTADHEVSDGARIVEDAGERAPWSSGKVGLYGISYRGGTQIATADRTPDRDACVRSRRSSSVAPVLASAMSPSFPQRRPAPAAGLVSTCWPTPWCCPPRGSPPGPVFARAAPGASR